MVPNFDPTPGPILSAEERFWSRVEKSDGCWMWSGYIRSDGYGRVKVDQKSYLAHRLAYQLTFGTIPAGISIDHRCHNRGCVRPDHLRPATHKQNLENRVGATSVSTSGIRGVSWHAGSKKWRATVGHAGKKYCGGLFTSKHEAADAARNLRNQLFTYNDADRRENDS